MNEFQGMADQELLDYCHTNLQNEAAWEEFLKRCYPYIRYSARLLLPTSKIDDFVQVVAVKTFKAISKNQIPKNYTKVRLYISGIIKHTFFDYLRDKGQGPFQNEDFSERTEPYIDFSDDEPSELGVVLEECIARALVDFDPLEKVIIKFKLAGHDNKDIMSILLPGRSYDAVKMKVNRLMHEFRARLSRVINEGHKSAQMTSAQKSLLRKLYERLEAVLKLKGKVVSE